MCLKMCDSFVTFNARVIFFLNAIKKTDMICTSHTQLLHLQAATMCLQR